MATANTMALAAQARRRYTEALVNGLAGVVQAVDGGARELLGKRAEHGEAAKRREAATELHARASTWLHAMEDGLRQAAQQFIASATRAGDLPRPGASSSARMGKLSLVDDDTIEREILSSRLALAVMDRASWEFTDLRSRVTMLEGREELDTHDLLRSHVLARVVIDAWRTSGLGLESWRTLQPVLHEEFTALVEEGYHETNHWLVEQRVLPEVDLRPFIRRTRGAGTGGQTVISSTRGALGNVGEETRLMTRGAPLPPRGSEHAEAVLGRLNKLVGRQLPEFAQTAGRPASPGLAAAIGEAQLGLQRRFRPSAAGAEAVVTTPALLEDLHQRKQALKQAASTPVERATIEIVALLFQSILMEERIPAAVRVWFARLQMPTLRVAVGEPDFFATVDHPARRLIDRMGACVMGFDTSARAVGDALEKEIKRVVQVVEAYPDTGRRVFQTVLTEFEKFLEHYFKNENEATRKGVSLAQQVEQRETLAIQYTIELRKMLESVPVQEGVRQFLFQVWADVLAMTAVKFGAQAEETKAMKRAAADLIWSAGAKVSREERAEVIRRLPPLLKTLREGMAGAGLVPEKQDEHIRTLNNSLAAAFTAKAAAIPTERLEELMERLETLEELLPEAGDVQIDESMVLDLSGHDTGDLEVVSEGGSMPTPAMLAWARELQVGTWYMLDYRNRNEAVQLAWQGLRKQLTLFVSPAGRGILFQQQRLASFLQAGLLLPAQDEALTVRATRSALAKLDVDPSRLMS
ncbi:MAG TPA: DUF1631 family protein [Burkholderiaceae bacterium]|nr:DUF1631 family protein [Burkholderiaceae bacterium]